MADLPIQPTEEEIAQFPQAQEMPEPVEDNTDHEDVAEEHKATSESEKA